MIEKEYVDSDETRVPIYCYVQNRARGLQI
jgi:hypothetical protein